MQLPTGPDHRSRVEDFRRRHRVAFLTLLFTDIVGSTGIKQRLGDTRAVMLIQRHHAALRELLATFREGEEIETAGDSFFVVFTKPSDAVRFSLQFQQQVRALAAETGEPVLDRIGVHVGEVFVQEHAADRKAKDLYGLQVDTCARVMGLGQGNQILMTRSVFDSARQILKGEELAGLTTLEWLNHGPYRMKGVEDPVEVCEVGERESAVLRPPADSEKAYRHVSADSEPVLGWRPAVGQTIPDTQWELLEKLGEGGFGEVWLARHATLGQRRVVKFCFRADHVRSLRREVALFRLLTDRVGKHPNVTTLHDVFFEQPPFYLVTDYAPGRDLVTWCRSHGGVERIPLETRLEIVAQIADALQAAQDAGIVHRDVKPSNILLNSPDLPTAAAPVQALLADFGIGVATNPEALDGAAGAGFSMTVHPEGAVTGTLSYLAPEILAGGPATPRSDLYSLGVVLFQLVVGDLDHPVTTDWAAAVGDPLLRADLENCFAGKPERRFAGAGELARRLRALPERRARREAETRAQRERERAAQRRGMMRVFAAAGTLVLAFAALAGWAWQQTARARSESVARLREWQRAEQESTNRLAQWKRAERSLMLLDYDEVDREFTGHRLPQAVARLAAAARNHPDEILPVTRLAGLVVARAPTFSVPDPAVSLPAEAGIVLWARFTPDGRRLVTQSRDRLVRTWDASTGTPLGSPFGLVRKAVPDAGTKPAAPFLLGKSGASPDCRELVTLSGRSAQLWDAAGGAPIGEPLAHQGDIVSARFSPDGRNVATTSFDKTARLWDAATGKPLGEPLLHEGTVWSAHFSPDGSRLATRSTLAGSNAPRPRAPGDPITYYWRVWDVATGRPLGTPFRAEGVVLAEFFGPDGLRVITDSNGTTVRIWDVTAGRIAGQPIQVEGGIRGAAFGPDGRKAVIVTGKSVQIWDAATAMPLGSPIARDASAPEASFGPDGLRIMTVSADNTVQVWDAATGRAVGGPIRHRGHVWVAAFGPDGARVVTASEDPRTRITDVVAASLPPGEPLRLATRPADAGAAPRFDDYLRMIGFSRDGRRVVTAMPRETTARVWDGETGRPLGPALPHETNLVSAAMAADGRKILTVTAARTARIWNVADGAGAGTPLVLGDRVLSANFSWDGNRVVTGSEDATARVWDAGTGRPLGGPLKHAGKVVVADFSPDGRRIVTGSEAVVRVWDTETGRPIGEPLRHDGRVVTARFSLTGDKILTGEELPGIGSTTMAFSAWEPATGKPTGKRFEQGSYVGSPHFAPDGRQIVACAGDGTARIWDMATGIPLGEPFRDESPIRMVRFSPDGARLVTLSEDRTARVWDVATRKPLGETLSLETSVGTIAFFPDGQRFATGSTDGARVRDVPWPLAPKSGATTAADPLQTSLVAVLSEYAEGCVGLRYLGDGRFETATNPPSAALEQGRRFFATSAHPLAGLLRWLAMDPRERTVAPTSRVTTREWIEGRIGEDTAESLHDAAVFQPTNAVVLARYALRLAEPAGDAGSRTAGDADFLSRRAMELAPDDAAVRALRALVLQKLEPPRARP